MQVETPCAAEQPALDGVLEQRPDDFGCGIVQLDAEDVFGRERGAQFVE